MKFISKILFVVCCAMPITATAAPIATTLGSNLTGYNGNSSVATNQWNTMTNPRANIQNTTVKNNFGNCNALILRCATPKCAGGGCADAEIAKQIVVGCVNTNASCKQYGDDLVNFISAQLVSDSVAAQNAAAAAATAAANQSAEQIANMQQQMQMQMAQMQEQNNAQISALQDALQESQRANQEMMLSAAESAKASAPSAVDADTGLNATQTAAAQSGVDAEVIQRATITGQILTGMESVDSSLNQLKTTMRDAFRYGGCNEINGDNCTGPKRVKKFKELSMKFFDPYDALVDNLEDALLRAQSVGVDMGDIYMLLSGSCNRYAKYICMYNGETPVYHQTVSSSVRYVSVPVPSTVGIGVSGGEVFRLKPSGLDLQKIKLLRSGLLRNLSFVSEAYADSTSFINCDEDGKSIPGNGVRGGHDCADGMVIPPEDLVACTVNEIYNDVDGYEKVQEAWLNPDESSTGIIRVGCASDIVNSGILGRRARTRKSVANIDVLQYLIMQDAPNTKDEIDSTKIKNYCATAYLEPKLKSATMSRSLPQKMCCDKAKEDCNGDCNNDFAYVDPTYALCNVHRYNLADGDIMNPTEADTKEKVRQNVALKTTVIAQQMYKQYVMIESMIKRLKIQLEKAVLNANLQVAGGTSSKSSDDSVKVEFSDCGGKSAENALNCVQSNYTKLKPFVDKGNSKRTVREQLYSDFRVLKAHLDTWPSVDETKCKVENVKDKKTMKDCLDLIEEGITKLDKQITNEKSKQNYRYPWG